MWIQTNITEMYYVHQIKKEKRSGVHGLRNAAGRGGFPFFFHLKKERKEKGWCVFSRYAMQMRQCILDPVRWMWYLHLSLPEEREGMTGRHRETVTEGREHLQFSPTGKLSLFFPEKTNWLDETQISQLVRR